MWTEKAQYPRDALCVDADPELFFPVDEDAPRVDGADPPGVARAKSICALCPVRSGCLDANIGEPFGILGGLTAAERRALRRRAAAARRRAAA